MTDRLEGRDTPQKPTQAKQLGLTAPPPADRELADGETIKAVGAARRQAGNGDGETRKRAGNRSDEVEAGGSPMAHEVSGASHSCNERGRAGGRGPAGYPWRAQIHGRRSHWAASGSTARPGRRSRAGETACAAARGERRGGGAASPRAGGRAPPRADRLPGARRAQGTGSWPGRAGPARPDGPASGGAAAELDRCRPTEVRRSRRRRCPTRFGHQASGSELRCHHGWWRRTAGWS